MGSYLDMSGRLDEDRSHWYVHGPDRGLVAAAYRELRDLLGARCTTVERLDGAQVGVDEVRSRLLADDEWEGRLLLVLDNAEHVDLSFLMDERPADLHASLLAVGAESKAPESQRRYAHFFRRGTARMVRCASGGEARLARWVQLRVGCLQGAAVDLVKMAGGDTAWLASEVAKLRATGIGEALEAPIVPLVTCPGASGSLVTALLSSNLPAAIAAIPTPAEAPGVLRELERMLLNGALLQEAQQNVGWSTRQLVERTGLSQKQLGILRTHTGTFDRQATERRLTVLARVSEQAIRGERPAWLSIIACW